MANPVITAAVLIEANGAALNNSGDPIERARTDNTVSVKSIRIGGGRYPYISGQAWRRWWRETLYEDFGWKPSPVTREAKSAYTDGNPVDYPDDDIFGFMAAKKNETQKRVAPLKNSLLISVLPSSIQSDFAHFSRNLPVDNTDPVPFEFEHYTTYLQGVFSLSMIDAGRFEIGKMRDLPETFTPVEGKASISEDSRVKAAILSPDERRNRIAQCIEALSRLRHGANLTRNLCDVTPVAILIGFIDGGNAPFQRIFDWNREYGNDKPKLNIERLKAIMSDYNDRLLPVQCPIIFGALPGIIENEDEVRSVLGDMCTGTSTDAIKKAASIIRNGDWLTKIWG